MSRSKLADSDLTGSPARSAPNSPVPEPPGLPVSELDSIVAVLTAKFSTCTRARVRDVVYETHRRLAATARVRAHLIPLTVNLSRSQLELETRAPRPTATRR
ncbi:three-helix bundle dimerization domain-containing protein [Mycolicibacterium chlorophenolicum]|uniref:three-helix bundle dimerization domain-containing protein n=1 Tax=Mycolicibacterium chlorophenolicum TaxID=37916 RepID=UPI000A7B28AA